MKKFIALTLSFVPGLAFAQTQINNINDVATTATRIGNLAVTLAISFAVIWIIVSVVRFFIAGGEEDKKKGKEAIIYGVIGLFLILSIWGLVFILTNTFRTNNNVPQNIRNGNSNVLPSTLPRI